jgi:HlyD family secretion protein
VRRILFAGALVLALAACGAKPPAVLQGYAEADYLYLAPREAGIVNALAVKEGDSIKKGALIFRLDVDRSNAALARARAQRSATGQTATAQAQAVAEARADVTLAQTTYNRSRALYKDGYAPKAKLDQDKAALDVASARLRTASAQRQAAASQTGASGADVALAQAQADDRSVVAPADGRIERIFLRPGEMAQAGAPVASMLPPGNMKLRFFAPEAQLSLLALGGMVDVACDQCVKGMTARISYIASEPQFTPPVIYSKDQRAKLVYLVEARPEKPELFRPGQPVDVSLREKQGAGS